MKKQFVIITGTAAAVILAASLAFAQKTEKPVKEKGVYSAERTKEGREGFRKDGFKKGKGQRGFHVERMMKHLNLTEEQQTKIKGIVEASKKKNEPIRAEIKILRAKMKDEWQKANPNEGAIISLHRKIHELNGIEAETRIAVKIDVMAVLTQEQRDQMIQKMSERSERGARGERGEMGNRKGKGPCKGFSKSKDKSGKDMNRKHRRAA